MELYYVLSIVDRSRADELLAIHNELQLSLVLTKNDIVMANIVHAMT